MDESGLHEEMCIADTSECEIVLGLWLAKYPGSTLLRGLLGSQQQMTRCTDCLDKQKHAFQHSQPLLPMSKVPSSFQKAMVGCANWDTELLTTMPSPSLMALPAQRLVGAATLK